MKEGRRTMGEDTFPAAAGERGGKVCLVWGLVVTEPDLGGPSEDDGRTGDGLTHIAVDTVDYVLGR